MEQDFEEHLKSHVGKLVIAFAGGNQDRYQFGPTLKKLGVSHVLMRDTTQCYHGKGVRGIGSRWAVVDYIRDLMYNRCYFSPVTTIGVSSGAYAALLYGQMTPVQQIIAISPLTGREVDDFDPRWHQQIIDPAQPDMDDLRKYFPNGPFPKTHVFISNGEATELDRQMATRLNIKDKNITLIPGFAHGKLAAGMRDRGMFAELLG